MSLDGYIADDDGGYDWIVPVASPELDTADPLPFDDFLADVDLVVMGRHCYEQGLHEDYLAMELPVLVASRRGDRSGAGDGVRFSGDAVRDVRAAAAAGRHCFLFGGGILVSSFVVADAVDALTVGVVPVILGAGRRLFLGGGPRIDLALTRYAVTEGKVRLVYARRPGPS